MIGVAQVSQHLLVLFQPAVRLLVVEDRVAAQPRGLLDRVLVGPHGALDDAVANRTDQYEASPLNGQCVRLSVRSSRSASRSPNGT